MIYVNLLLATWPFSVKAASLVYQNNETVSILMYQNNPMGIELFFQEKTFFCFKIAKWSRVKKKWRAKREECGLSKKNRRGSL